MRRRGTIPGTAEPERTISTATAITTASTRIMNSGPKIIPDHPQPHIIGCPQV